MGALFNGGFWRNCPPKWRRFRSKSSDSVDGDGGRKGFNFPLKPAATAASLALTGDTIAQLSDRWKKLDRSDPNHKKDFMLTLLASHDWLRALRMASYGFLLYGPGSHVWYKYLDQSLPKQTLANLSLKVTLNQIVLGPCVIAVVFAWNNLWLGKLSELPNKYQKDAFPTLLYGFRFWIPASILNFGVVPLHGRVAFMSTCAIFWNYYLSSAMSN